MNPLEQIVEFLKQTDELSTARQLLKTFNKYSNSIDQYDTIARLFNDVKAYPEAIEAAEKTLALSANPQQLYSSRANLAKLYNHNNEPHKALNYINVNLSINPNDYEALMEKVFSLYLQADFAQSKQLTIELLNDPNTPDNIRERCKFNYGSYLLDEDKFQEGLQHFIGTGHGSIQIWKSVEFPGPTWEGDIVQGKNIAIQAEGGIGDEIINIRFMHHIKQLGMNPIFITNREELQQFFTRNGFQTVSNKFEVPQDSEFCLAMFLPILLKIKPEDLWNGAYLTPDPTYVEKWKNTFNEMGITGKKVGLRWSGNQYYEANLSRTLPLEELDKVLDFSRTDVTFISVQREDNEALQDYPTIKHVHTETVEDLLAVLSLMDTTISSCTSIAHFAAAAGLNLHVCPPLSTYYTWLGTTKWYGENCHIHRQTKYKDYSHLNAIKL